jgi:hypothetical protein
VRVIGGDSSVASRSSIAIDFAHNQVDLHDIDEVTGGDVDSVRVRFVEKSLPPSTAEPLAASAQAAMFRKRRHAAEDNQRKRDAP